jgi:hypothetical protein
VSAAFGFVAEEVLVQGGRLDVVVGMVGAGGSLWLVALFRDATL